MTEQETKNDKIERDLTFVAKIAEGDDTAWEAFVERFTDWTLYKAKEWCTDHCGYSAGTYLCGLTSIRLQREGRKVVSDLPECDEGLDTYIWLLERLRKKVTKYSGKNGSLLSTFVWTILNSRELYIDWLRWKYGRAF